MQWGPASLLVFGAQLGSSRMSFRLANLIEMDKLCDKSYNHPHKVIVVSQPRDGTRVSCMAGSLYCLSHHWVSTMGEGGYLFKE